MLPRRLLSIAGAAVVLISASIFVPVHRAAATPPASHWGSDYFPNVALTTQDGKTVHFYDDLLKDKIVAIDLIYTHCEYSCPLETARLAQVQHILGDRVGKDIFFYSISIDPKRDTPEVLKAFAEKFHAGPGWEFLTGKPEDIELISKKLGLYSDPKATKDGHTPTLMIGNVPDGQWMRNSATDNPQFLAIMIGNYLNGWKANKAATLTSYTEAPQLNLNKGKYIFSTHCAACHTIGQGDQVGPDLRGVTGRRNSDWLARYIADPDKLLAQKDPTALALFEKYKQVRMPNLRLNSEDVDSLIDYLKTQSQVTVGGTSTTAAKD